MWSRWAKTARRMYVREEVSAADVLVDGIGIGDIGSVVLRDRHQPRRTDFLLPCWASTCGRAKLCLDPKSKRGGFVYSPNSESIIEGAKQTIRDAVTLSAHDTGLSATLKQVLGEYLYKTTRRRPMIIPVVTEL